MKFFNLFFLLTLSFCSFAKVAYLPVSYQHGFFPSQNSIQVFDLDNSEIIRTINFGTEIEAVFLNNANTRLYVAAPLSKKIFLVDTTSLEIISQFQNLPVRPDQIALNSSSTALYFRGPDNNVNDKLYKIDLNTSQVSIAFDFSGENVERIVYSDNLSYLLIITASHITTIDLDNELIVSTINNAWGINLNFTIDNGGENIFFSNYSNNSFDSHKLSDGSLNWVFQPGTETHYFLPHVNVDNTITVVGYENTYKININTGLGNIISNINTSGFNNSINAGGYNLISADKLLTVNYPYAICITGMCHLSQPLDISIVDFTNNTVTNFYHSDQFGGSSVSGKFIGQNRYAPTVIPVINSFFTILTFMMFILFIAYRLKQNKELMQ